jgi:hypothetical protein
LYLHPINTSSNQCLHLVSLLHSFGGTPFVFAFSLRSFGSVRQRSINIFI